MWHAGHNRTSEHSLAKTNVLESKAKNALLRHAEAQRQAYGRWFYATDGSAMQPCGCGCGERV
jgi:hypothetical protein